MIFIITNKVWFQARRRGIKDGIHATSGISSEKKEADVTTNETQPIVSTNEDKEASELEKDDDKEEVNECVLLFIICDIYIYS